jgi:hypothetical protein
MSAGGMIVQLSPLIPLETPRGPAMAHFMIDPGFEHHLQWVCFIDATGECWTFGNPQVRLSPNQTARPSRGSAAQMRANPSTTAE